MGEMIVADIFKPISAALDAAGIQYMLVGSFASSHWGEYRSTNDIDVVVSGTPDQVRDFINLLPADRYYRDLESALEACKHRDMFNILDMQTGLKIDLIFLKGGEFDREAFRRRSPELVDGAPLVISSPEDVIIAKLERARMGHSLRQIEDVAVLLRRLWNSLDHQYIKKWIIQLGLNEQWVAAKESSRLE
jgi:hypothetical protein